MSHIWPSPSRSLNPGLVRRDFGLILIPQRTPLFAGGLHTSAWIPPLLGAYYASAGGLLIAADSLLDGKRSQNGARLQAPPGDGGSLASVALAFGCAWANFW